LRDTYYESAVHVCNSVDNFESGTLPVLESMACGVPVLSRKVGHIPDIYNGENLRLLEGQPKDIEGIKKNLRELMEDRDLRLSMRESALKTVSCRSEKKWSQDYKKVFTSIVNSSRVKI
jgi:glycosyltransferase involved in cell wall biosynthesis